MDGWPRVVVVGPGGVGGYFGAMLARAGAPVTMLGRPGRPSAHLDAMARDGLRLEAKTFDERVSVEASTKVEVVGQADLVLFCVKTTDTDEASRSIAPHVRSGAIVVDLQNGADNPERMRRAGVDPIAAVVYVAAAVERPGEVKHRGRGDLVIGHRERRQDVERVAGWLERAGIPCRISDDVECELWVKLILNSMANAVSALTGATYGRLAEFEPTWKVATDVAREGVAVARAAGHDLEPDDVIRQGLEVCRAVGAATSSTQQAIARGRPTEIDSLNGYITRRGTELGVSTPINRTLWALVKLRESEAAD
ncbi:MAG: ketopantoate reductase family protein [Planctomycetota bacterium]|jgi:2-dehydropantoate 2-reductase